MIQRKVIFRQIQPYIIKLFFKVSFEKQLNTRTPPPNSYSFTRWFVT